MNRDSSIIQVAVLLIIIAVLGVAILQKQSPWTTPARDWWSVQTGNQVETQKDERLATWTVSDSADSDEVADENSRHANLIKQYFLHLANKEYTQACTILSPAKCASNRPAAVELFQNEFEKLANWYEYLAVRDFWMTAPSGKHVTCVKYAYRYLDDANPGLISEIMSFYTDTVDGRLVITDRVCEKKYKEWWWVRPCPIQANQEFCEGKIK